jgi:hypothetical protein
VDKGLQDTNSSNITGRESESEWGREFAFQWLLGYVFLSFFFFFFVVVCERGNKMDYCSYRVRCVLSGVGHAKEGWYVQPFFFCDNHAIGLPLIPVLPVYPLRVGEARRPCSEVRINLRKSYIKQVQGEGKEIVS